MLPSPSPRFYLVGAILSGVGALLLAIRSELRKRPDARPQALLAAAIFALAAGLVVVGAGLWIDVQYSRDQNTMELWYHVSVQMNGTGPVTLLLPAPTEERFFNALNATNGSSTLRLQHAGSDTSVVLTAFGNVTFQIHATIYPLGNVRYSRVVYLGYGSTGPLSNATIELTTVSSVTSVLLDLDASTSTVCQGWALMISAVIQEGVAQYPADTPGIVC